MVKRPVNQTQRAPHMEWEFMCIAGEEVIGKAVGAHQGSRIHSP